MARQRFRYARLALGVLCLTACNPIADHRELARMRLRVDSLAVIVTAMNAAQGGRGATTAPAETLTVSATGVASLGDSSAPVTIVEFTDFQCPFCRRHAMTTLDSLRRGDIAAGKVRYVVRDLPISELHPWATKAAISARCARDQSVARYWAYHDALFRSQPGLADSLFPQLADQVGLDVARFQACMKSGRFASAVEADRMEALSHGMDGTPSFVVGLRSPGDRIHGQLIRGAQSIQTFENVIRAVQQK